MEHRPLRSWSRDQQQKVEAAVDELLRAWQQDWGLAALAAIDAARCTAPAAEDADAGWKGAPHAAGTGQLWWDCALPPGDSTDDLLVAALFDAGHVTAGARVAAGVAQAAWSDFWQRAGDRLSPERPGLPLSARDCFQPWSGALVIALPWCGRELRLLVAGAAVERFLGAGAASSRAAAPAPSPLWDALAPVQCSLRVELEPVELTLGAVKALRVGDVVELPHRLEAPLLARTGEGLLCEAWLGKVADHRGIELTRTPGRPH